MGDFTIQQFEADVHQNGIRFWYAHEFMKSLGYDVWFSFQKVITKAMGACARLEIDPTEAFLPATYLEDGKEVKTYKLSRFACFLVSMYADSNKPEVALAKASLAAIAATLVEDRIRETDLGRIDTRDDLKLAEKVLGGVAQSAGLIGPEFGIFKDAGFRGMYNMSLSNLMTHKGVGSNWEPILARLDRTDHGHSDLPATVATGVAWSTHAGLTSAAKPVKARPSFGTF